MAEPRITPEEEALRRRARRRLVGSLALALLAIVILPMVFEPEPKPLGDDVEIVIPGQDTPFKPSGIADNRPPAAPAASQAAQNQPPLATPPVELAPIPPREAKPAAAALKQPEAKSPPAAKPAPADKPAKPAKPAPTPEKAEPKPAAKPVAPDAKAAAKPVAPDAKPATPAARTVTPTGVKPDAKPEAKPADKAQAKAEAKPVEKPQAKAETADTAGSHFLQLGSFGAEANAKQLADKIKAAGYPVKVIAGQGAFKVRVGPYAHRDTATQALGVLKSKGFSPVMVTP